MGSKKYEKKTDKQYTTLTLATSRKLWLYIGLRVVLMAIEDASCTVELKGNNCKIYPSYKTRKEAKEFLLNIENTIYYDLLEMNSEDVEKIRRLAGL